VRREETSTNKKEEEEKRRDKRRQNDLPSAAACEQQASFIVILRLALHGGVQKTECQRGPQRCLPTYKPADTMGKRRQGRRYSGRVRRKKSQHLHDSNSFYQETFVGKAGEASIPRTPLSVGVMRRKAGRGDSNPTFTTNNVQRMGSSRDHDAVESKEKQAA